MAENLSRVRIMYKKVISDGQGKTLCESHTVVSPHWALGGSSDKLSSGTLGKVCVSGCDQGNGQGDFCKVLEHPSKRTPRLCSFAER